MRTQPTIMLIVRGLKSKLTEEELDRRYKERMPRFRAFPGLVQKYYTVDETTGEWAGVYLWDSEESLAAYLESDLRKSIPAAYELVGPPQIERFAVIDVLRT
jgi:heme-degrading monooxygenase HmoA